jgi:hypothetical protein
MLTIGCASVMRTEIVKLSLGFVRIVATEVRAGQPAPGEIHVTNFETTTNLRQKERDTVSSGPLVDPLTLNVLDSTSIATGLLG